MEILFKILAFLLLAAGAFIVYGAKLIASWVAKSNGNTGNAEIKESVQLEKSNPETGRQDADETGEKPDLSLERQIVNIKITGTLLIIAGAILVLIVFR